MALEPREAASFPRLDLGASGWLLGASATEGSGPLVDTEGRSQGSVLLKNVPDASVENKGGTHFSFMESVLQQESIQESGAGRVRLNASFALLFFKSLII